MIPPELFVSFAIFAARGVNGKKLRPSSISASNCLPLFIPPSTSLFFVFRREGHIANRNRSSSDSARIWCGSCLISLDCINDSYRSSNPACFSPALDVESLTMKNDASLNRQRDDDEGEAAAIAIIRLMLSSKSNLCNWREQLFGGHTLHRIRITFCILSVSEPTCATPTAIVRR